MTKNGIIVFDASIFEIPLTGVGKTTLFLYEACRKALPTLRFLGIHKNPLPIEYPPHLEFKRTDPSTWQGHNLSMSREKNSVSIAHFPWNGPIPRKMSLPVVMTLHDILPLEIPNHLGRNPLRRWSFVHKTKVNLSRCTTVFTVSEYSKRKILENFRVRQEPVVNYWGPTLDLQDRVLASEPNSGEFFVYVGGYDRRKGLVPMVKAFVNLSKQRRIASRLIMTGTPRFVCEELDNLLREGESMGVVEQKGYVSDRELVDLFHKGKGLVYLSKYEGFGMPPLESMHVGCPVITTRGTSIPEVCGEAAWYVDPDRDEEIATAIETLAHNPARRKEMVAKGKKQASRFTWENCAATFLSVFQNISGAA